MSTPTPKAVGYIVGDVGGRPRRDVNPVTFTADGNFEFTVPGNAQEENSTKLQFAVSGTIGGGTLTVTLDGVSVDALPQSGVFAICAVFGANVVVTLAGSTSPSLTVAVRG